MATIVTAYSASHAPMMTANPRSAPPESHDRFFGALGALREEARAAGAQAVVLVSGEHFTNFFLDNLPQVCVGVGEAHVGPVETWLGIERAELPGQPGLAEAVLAGLIARGHWASVSHQLVLDHGFMTVYHDLAPDGRLPIVPIVVNCTTPPLLTLRQAWQVGVDLGAAIRECTTVERVALVGAGGLSHFVGEPRIGDIDEEFDRWFLAMLEKGCPDELLDLPNDELLVAGNGTGEVRAWVMVAGAMAGRGVTTLAYEPIYEWINGMGVVRHEPDLP